MSIHPEQHPLDGKLEPETKDCFNDRAPLYSIAISLKRIADAPSEAAARITELEGDLKAAFREISKLAREAGEAKGRLAMSEAAGIVDGWRERAERAEARCRALESASPAEPSGWRPIDQAPDLGRKIVALFGDGSGASMFWRHDGGYIDADGDEWGELPDHYALWTYLPDSFQFWCEYRSDEPMTLTLPPTSEGGGA